jgi:glycosyltransferase involved in cell wall biosynthesis
MKAFHALLAAHPECEKTVKLLMIGDGMTLPEAKRLARQYEMGRRCVFTGMVPQADGPKYLAACDLLVAPHVPNPDGSPFFGSPTKLFEYMAMGKGIVASDLEQIGEVLEDGKTALLVKPGDAAGLAEGIYRLCGDPLLRGSLGREARRRALEKHTWEEHTRRIVHKLQQLSV